MALPRTLGELQLYRVLQRANLLGYYETFIQQGGDDVQQLCEAGEEEFLEIMALVGMATKPLHVRRLQKALREWAANPGLFSQPVPAVPVSSIPLFKLAEPGSRKALSNGRASPSEAAGKAAAATPPARSPSEPPEKLSPSAVPPWPSPESEGGGDEEPAAAPLSPGGGGEQAGTEALEPELARMVAESVERLLQSCPRGTGGSEELRALLKLNKKLAKAVGHIFHMDDSDRQKEEEIRRHSAIYGRGETRRRDAKPLGLHEVRRGARGAGHLGPPPPAHPPLLPQLLINEAAAQFCLRDNSLLLRRVELFSLSRQVARESSYLSSLRGAR
ncbi:NAB2 protein, partial [Nothocercus nigrocapillus]|nr:NAB2 protein [Nothocercus nigrocapillus]